MSCLMPRRVEDITLLIIARGADKFYEITRLRTMSADLRLARFRASLSYADDTAEISAIFAGAIRARYWRAGELPRQPGELGARAFCHCRPS